MNKINNVILCGLGAIGTAIGEKILTNRPEALRVLVDNERHKRYSKTPRVLNGRELHFEYVLPQEEGYKADLIIIAVKAKSLPEVINNINNFVTQDTIIISLLNGVTSEELIAERYGWDKLLLSYYIGSSAMRSGEEIRHNGRATIVFGSKDGLQNDKINLLKNFFNEVGIKYKVPDDMPRNLWLKFMLNVACNQLSAIMNLNFGQMQQSEDFKILATKVMKEVELCAKAVGIKNTETMLEEVFTHIQTITPEGKTSMLQDVEAGRETEVDIFAGTVIKLGEKYNIPTPYNDMIKKMIDIIYLKEQNRHNLETHYKTLQ